MTQMNRSFLIRITLVLLVGNLYGCGGYQNKVIAANEASAIAGLHVIYNYEQIKHEEMKKYVPLDQLFSQDDAIRSPTRSNPGYHFEVRLGKDGESFEALASPAEYNKSGRRSFYMNEQGVIHSADKGGSEGTLSDPEVR